MVYSSIGPYAGVDYNLTLCPLQSRLQHIYHGQPYATVDLLPQSETLDLASVQYCNVLINRSIVGQCLHVLVAS